MTNINNILEACLQGLEHGADLETLLSNYPEHAKELRPILNAAIHARKMAVTAPSAEVSRRGRAKFMQRAAELRELKVTPRKRAFPAFQRLAITLTLTAMFLASGTGLVRASSSALPGENLYPVKRSWEDLRLIFTFDDDQREGLEFEFENERLEEVSGLIAEGRHETIQFAGVFMDVNGKTYVSGVQVVITENTQLPPQVIENGAAVVITGHTNSEGFVEAELIELLPTGTVVPAGSPVEVESEEESEQKTSPSSGSGSGSESETKEDNSGGDNESESGSVNMVGTVDSVSGNSVVINGQSGNLEGAQIEGEVRAGAGVEVEGYIAADGSFVITKIKVKDSNTGSGNNEDKTGSDAGSNSGSGSSGSGDDDDHSGSGGGGGGGDGDDDDDD